MASTNFVDYVKTFCRSGAGGRGSAHLHRDKRTMKGGPDGGDMYLQVTAETEVKTGVQVPMVKMLQLKFL